MDTKAQWHKDAGCGTMATGWKWRMDVCSGGCRRVDWEDIPGKILDPRCTGVTNAYILVCSPTGL